MKFVGFTVQVLQYMNSLFYECIYDVSKNAVNVSVLFLLSVCTSGVFPPLHGIFMFFTCKRML